MKPLTSDQTRTLRSLEEFVREHERSPCIGELADYMGRTGRAVGHHVRCMELAGYIDEIDELEMVRPRVDYVKPRTGVRECVVCGEAFRAHRRKITCSDECSRKRHNQTRRARSKCVICGKPIGGAQKMLCGDQDCARKRRADVTRRHRIEIEANQLEVVDATHHMARPRTLGDCMALEITCSCGRVYSRRDLFGLMGPLLCECGLKISWRCPWVSCRYHLYLDVEPSGWIKIRHDHEDGPLGMPKTCALDVVASHGAVTLEEVGEFIGATGEYVRQIQDTAMQRLRERGIEFGVVDDRDPGWVARRSAISARINWFDDDE